MQICHRETWLKQGSNNTVWLTLSCLTPSRPPLHCMQWMHCKCCTLHIVEHNTRLWPSRPAEQSLSQSLTMGDGGFPCDSLQQAYLPKFTIAEERCSYIFWWLGTDFETLTVKNAIAHIRFVISQKIVLGSEDSIRNSWCLFTPIMVRFDQFTKKPRCKSAKSQCSTMGGRDARCALVTIALQCIPSQCWIYVHLSIQCSF